MLLPYLDQNVSLVAVDAVRVLEPDSGDVAPVEVCLRVELGEPPFESAASFQLFPSAASTASAGIDFTPGTAIVNVPLRFSDEFICIEVEIIGDDAIEGNETIFYDIRTQNFLVESSFEIRIVDNDGML